MTGLKAIHMNTISKPKSGKLSDIYYFYLNDEIPSAHRAESDVMALIACTVAAGQEFVNWMDKNAKDFNKNIKVRDCQVDIQK
ncbi:hypothetical protein QYM36_010879 [Artemia franciscana]|uniref:Exonuclease domain-containing protein n=2 Tax=Artemia franciscana TaxID=6661 RepID=A0AA88HIN9_ARTSF|nr:hypothetical protein QYM36_010879 [Artemia franciscana]